MFEVEKPFESRSTPKYSSRSAVRRSGTGVRRLVFFMLAAMWGFIAGVIGVLVAFSAAGESVSARPAVIFGLIPALILSLAGALVVAAAYRESKARAR